MTALTKDEIIAWAIQAGLDQEFWLAETHPNFDNEMRMLTTFAHLCRADLVAENESLRAELGQYPEIQAMLMSENKQLRAKNAELEAQIKAPIMVETIKPHPQKGWEIT